MSVRDVEVRLTKTEDQILGRLGYREYSVTIGTTTLDPVPEVIMKPSSSFGSDQIQDFIRQLGDSGNPVAYFKVTISRLIPESVVRQFARWRIARDGYEADCLPVSIEVTDSRYVVIAAILKQVVTP